MTEQPFQVMPPLDDDQRHALRQSIAANGVLQPVELDELGRILDGHHRAEIATELGVDYPTRIVAGLADDAAKRRYAITVNVTRRQLTPAMRSGYVAQLRAQGMSIRQIAQETGLPKTTVARDLDQLSHLGQLAQPERITGADGRTRPATRPQSPAVRSEPAPEASTSAGAGPQSPARQDSVTTGVPAIARPDGPGNNHPLRTGEADAPLADAMAEAIDQAIGRAAQQRADRDALCAPREVVDAVNAATHFVPALVRIQSACEDLLRRVADFDPERAVTDLPDQWRNRLDVAREAHAYLTRVVDALDRTGVPA